MTKTFPCINNDGSIGELVLHPHEFRNDVYHKRSLYRPYRGCDYEEVVVSNYYFHRKEVAYKIDPTRMVQLTLYVQSGFMDHIPSEALPNAINKFVKENAPWLFSYGERVHRECPIVERMKR